MEEITIGVNEIYKAVQLVSEIGSENEKNVKNINLLVNKFKTE